MQTSKITMFSLSYLSIVLLVVLRLSLGDFTFDGFVVKPSLDPSFISGSKPQAVLNIKFKPTPGQISNPLQQYELQETLVPQCIPMSASIFAREHNVTVFTNTFLQAIYKTDILREAFDLSQTTAKQYGNFVIWYTKRVLRMIGVQKELASAVGEFAGRAIAPNFDVLTLGTVSRAYANMAANFLFVEGYLKSHNVEDLVLLYIRSMLFFVDVDMDSEPTSKFHALADGFVHFFSALGLFTTIKAPILGYYVGNEWFLAAVNYRQL